MVTHLVKWDEAYKEKGLVIIDVDNGSIDKKAAIQKHIEDKKIGYATLWDKGGAVCKDYRVSGYPASYLIGVEGTVIWEGHGSDDTVEDLIKKELEKVKKEEK